MNLSTHACRASVLGVLVGLLLACAPTAWADASVQIGDQFRTGLHHPTTLSLWASDALVKLRWNGWGTAVATASGQVSTHAYGKYSYSPARAVASRIRVCNGHPTYTRLRYLAFGQWHRAHRYGCQFSA